MDDSQLERELAALEGTPAENEKPSEAETKTPGEGEEGQAETETTEAEAEAEESDAGDDAGEDDKAEGEGDDETEKPEEEDKPRKKPSGSERLKRRIAALERELETRSRGTDGAVDQAAVESVIGKAPREEDFKGDFLAFERAQTAYEVRKAIQEDRQREQAQARSAAEQSALQDMIDDHADRVAEFKTKVPDFDAVIKGVAGKHPLNETLFKLLIESDKSAHLAYSLAKNPERIDRLNAMSPVAAAREIGRIESRLALPQPKTQTQAKRPVVPPKGGAKPPSADDQINKYLSDKYGPRR
jgi:hypothetical protein